MDVILDSGGGKETPQTQKLRISHTVKPETPCGFNEFSENIREQLKKLKG